ncbi:MAG TPA: Wzy polymerase domain-containing protein [Aquabacterium sp.]|nr:Wzy polymerase domain-containing protein [Aquabacterium sp.]
MTLSAEIDPRLSTGQWAGLIVGALLAVVLPTLIAAHDPPSITFYNQALAVCGWGAWILIQNATLNRQSALPTQGQDWRSQARIGLIAVVGIMGGLAAKSWAYGHLPLGLAMMGVGMCAVAGWVCWAGWQMGRHTRSLDLFDLFAAAIAVAGLFGVLLGAIQAFAPEWADGFFIAETTLTGRAVGNLRQPNHLSTLLVWSATCAIWLGARKRLPQWVSIGLMALFVWGIVLTASRTGLVAMAFLLVWGVCDRQLPKPLRIALGCAPLLYALFWGGMWLVSHVDHEVTFAAETRLHDKSDISSSRFKIWANVLSLIAQHPWAGVGYGEFNAAWTLTPFPNRPIAFFDHTHNLLLQWAVEFGLPITALLVGLSLWAWLALIWQEENKPLSSAGASSVIVTTALLHSLLEYPLWYSYFLLPTAFAWGMGLASQSLAQQSEPGTNRSPRAPSPIGFQPWLGWGGVATMVISVWCTLDYQAAANIYAPRPGAGPLEERIAFGQKMPWFGYQADYADVTVPEDDEPPKPPIAFKRTLHNLIDARLMIAYARSLNAVGETDKARYVVARLKEFHNAMETDFLAECGKPGSSKSAGRPFQCDPPSKAYQWQDLLPN